jgi:hypothetical protein
MNFRLIKRYSKFVTTSKRLCVIAIFLLIIALVMVPMLNPKKKQFELILASKADCSSAAAEEEQSKMTNPKFFGVNLYNELYNLTAKSAIEQNKNHILLQQPIANISLKDDKMIELVSFSGIWQQLTKILSIDGHVDLKFNGYRALTDSAVIDVGNSLITGTSEIEISGPLGHLTASGFKAHINNKTIFFTGPIKASLYNKLKR